MNDNFTIFDSIDVQRANPKSTQSVVAALNATFVGIKMRKEEEALKYFRLGSLLLDYDKLTKKNKVSLREIGKIMNVSYRKISYMKTIARQFNQKEDKFLEKFTELNATSWDSFIGKYYPKQDKFPELSRKQTQKIGMLMTALKRGSCTTAMYETLKNIRDDINKYIPLGEHILDKNIISYNNCCSCDEPAPPEGWEIHKDEEFSYMQYPLCPNCNKPDYKLVAKMYVIYAIGLENVYDTIL